MIERLQAMEIKKQFYSGFGLACSLNAREGPLYAIVGPNGSGKSTLMRILGLIEPPDTGKVIYYIDGRSMESPYGNVEIRRKVVLVPARAGMFNETVFKNVAYGLRLRKVSKSTRGDRVIEALKETGLAGKEHINALQLSSGEAQRMALARALVLDPDILLLDEPTVSLDPYNTQIIEEIIRARKAASGKIMIIVTHNLHQARALSEFVIFMSEGKIMEMTASDTFFQKPATECARKFISGEVY